MKYQTINIFSQSRLRQTLRGLNIINNNITYYGGYTAANEWMNKMTVYEMLKSDSALKNSHPTIQAFYNSTAPASIVLCSRIADSLSTANYASAQSLLNAWTPATTIESNYKTYYGLALKQASNAAWTSTDSTQLINLAHLCIHTNGAAISKARALYNATYRFQYTVFNDECTQDDGGGGLKESNENSPSPTQSLNVKTPFSAEVYPNPTKSGFYLSTNCAENEEIQIVIQTMNGQKVLTQQCKGLSGNCFINTPHLSNGIYLVSITCQSTKEIITRKLTIQQ